MIAPLHFSLGDKERPCLWKRKKKRERENLNLARHCIEIMNEAGSLPRIIATGWAPEHQDIRRLSPGYVWLTLYVPHTHVIGVLGTFILPSAWWRWEGSWNDLWGLETSLPGSLTGCLFHKPQQSSSARAGLSLCWAGAHSSPSQFPLQCLLGVIFPPSPLQILRDLL